MLNGKSILGQRGMDIGLRSRRGLMPFLIFGKEGLRSPKILNACGFIDFLGRTLVEEFKQYHSLRVKTLEYINCFVFKEETGPPLIGEINNEQLSRLPAGIQDIATGMS
jgi:hypothetical protein